MSNGTLQKATILLGNAFLARLAINSARYDRARYNELVYTAFIKSNCGAYSLTAVSSKLAVSNRTLQHHLHQEGTSFQKVLDELREQLARHYLSIPNTGIK